MNEPTSSFPLFLPCAAGVEALLADEVQGLLPAAQVQTRKGGVSLAGDLDVVMRLNLHSRLAQRVLIQLTDGPYFDEHALYALACRIDWTQWITPHQTIRVDTTAHRSPLQSLNFATLRIKDGICDVLRNATGERPSVDTRHPDLSVVLHLGPEHATLYVDSSGEPLFKRGWREDKGDAPLKETLAAAMLAAAGWRGTVESGGALHDPCCGSGTIAIEAAQIACAMAPGMQRRFAFERWLPFSGQGPRLQQMKDQARQLVHASAVPIYASDVSFRMVDFARRNAERAGVAAYIQFNGGDALERPAPVLLEGMAGTLVVNPPYGERIEVLGKAAPAASEQRDAPDDFLPRLAAHWKRAYTQQLPGWTAYMLSPDMKLPGKLRLKESRRIPLWNGPIECRLFRFDLVKGSARKPQASAEPDY